MTKNTNDLESVSIWEQDRINAQAREDKKINEERNIRMLYWQNLAEQRLINQVKHDVFKTHSQKIDPWFEYGTMWIKDINEDVAETVQTSMELFTGLGVLKTLSKPTETEPWKEWAFDV